MPGEARPERDEHRRGELEQEPDADRQPVNRNEIEPLHEREAADAVEDEERTSLRDMRRRSGATAARTSASPMKPKVARSSVSRSGVIPVARITFATAPLIANRLAAASVIA